MLQWEDGCNGHYLRIIDTERPFRSLCSPPDAPETGVAGEQKWTTGFDPVVARNAGLVFWYASERLYQFPGQGQGSGYLSRNRVADAGLPYQGHYPPILKESEKYTGVQAS